MADILLIQISWLLYALAWGTVRLYMGRSYISNDSHTTAEENSWAFGQCIPVLLLMLPLLAMVETSYGE